MFQKEEYVNIDAAESNETKVLIVIQIDYSIDGILLIIIALNLLESVLKIADDDIPFLNYRNPNGTQPSYVSSAPNSDTCESRSHSDAWINARHRLWQYYFVSQ